jgi:hypothetical protein
MPLKPIQRGRGVCRPMQSNSSIDTCGGPTRGTCTGGFVCECNVGWTGSRCLVPDGRDPIIWDTPDSILDLGLVAPSFIPRPLSIGLLFLCAMLLLVVTSTGRGGKQGWTRIPDVKVPTEEGK